MTTTTTITAILRHLVELIEDLTPDTMPDLPWRMVRTPGRPLALRPWLPTGGNDVFRCFEIEADPGGDLGANDPGAAFASFVVTVTVAYPLQPRRADNAFELAAILAEDAATLRDAVNSTAGRANVAHVATLVDRPTVNRSREDVWLMTLSATVAFYIEQRPRT